MAYEPGHELPRDRGRPAKLIASPIKLPGTPITYRHLPTLGRHTDEVLGGEALRDLRDRGRKQYRS